MPSRFEKEDQLYRVPSHPREKNLYILVPMVSTKNLDLWPFSGQVQRHSGFEWLCKHHRLSPEPIRSVRLDSGRAQSDGKSVNRGLPVLDLARGRDSWC